MSTHTRSGAGLTDFVLGDSARTWRDATDTPPAVPDALRPDPRASAGKRWRDLWQRHALRRERARAYLATSQSPERGLPVAHSRVVLGYVRGLLASRKGLVLLVVLANAVAAGSGLVVPLLLGDLVDATVAADGAIPQSTLTRLVLLVTLALVVQSVVTFLAKWLATMLGHGVLAQAREEIIRTVLRLPLGRVESASTGDLVTRVTRDVGAMSVR